MKGWNKVRFFRDMAQENTYDDYQVDDVKPVSAWSYCGNSDLFSTSLYTSEVRDVPSAEYERQAVFFESACLR